MNICFYLLYLYFLLRPYYFFNSGRIQICDIFFLIAIPIYLLSIKKNKDIKLIKVCKENMHYILFLFFVIIINLFYFIKTNDSRMLLCTLFYIYNFFIIIVFQNVINEYKFLKNIKIILNINLILQFVFMILGVGKYEYGTRYKGTFNDPNQFAFYCMISVFIIFLLNKIIKSNKYFAITYILGLILIINSSSTGMLAAYIIFSLLSVLTRFSVRKSTIKKIIISMIFIFLIISLITCIIMIFDIINMEWISSKISNMNILSRVTEKLSKINNDNQNNLLYDRGYDKILKHPLYVIFGAGEGGFSRFKDCVKNEIHATIPSLLFYYGIIPTMLLVTWIIKKIKGIPKSVYGVYIALFIESFTLINQRQSLFWLIILLATLLKKGDKICKEKHI